VKQVLHQKRWNSSARCIQYAATIIQLTLEVMQDHLLKAETNEYIGSLLTLLHSSDVHIKVRSGLGVLVLFFGRSASYLLFPSPLLSLSLSPSLPPSLSLSPSLFLSALQEWGANSIATIVCKAQGELVQDIMLHASTMKSIIAAISPQQDKYSSLTPRPGA
jgi:hypothetical protein